jgi:predicted transcriptional regulator
VDRLNILLELRKTPMKLSHVSKKFDFTVPETARNISRLHEASLIAKDVEGAFHLTPYGEEALAILSGFRFLSEHPKYFATHTVSALPPEFATGLGALENSKEIKELTTMLFNVENLLREAQQYIWFIADQILASALPLYVEAVERGVEIKKLMPRNANVPEGILKMANDPVFERAARAKKLESRYLNRIDVAIFLSEKEVAGICFPDLEGNFDYLGFTTRSESALAWSKSVFSYYWDRAKR